jgi:hypothetical protein
MPYWERRKAARQRGCEEDCGYFEKNEKENIQGGACCVQIKTMTDIAGLFGREWRKEF